MFDRICESEDVILQQDVELMSEGERPEASPTQLAEAATCKVNALSFGGCSKTRA